MPNSGEAGDLVAKLKAFFESQHQSQEDFNNRIVFLECFTSVSGLCNRGVQELNRGRWGKTCMGCLCKAPYLFTYKVHHFLRENMLVQ